MSGLATLLLHTLLVFWSLLTPRHVLGKTEQVSGESVQFSWKGNEWKLVGVDDGGVVEELADLRPAVYALELASVRSS